MDVTDYCTLLLLHHVTIFLFLFHSLRGQIQVTGPSRPIVATVGDDTIIPCHLEPAVNASGMRLEWARPDLSPGIVHVRANGQEYAAHQQPSYRGRTSVSISNLQHGDLSLKLSKVKVSDEGLYRCLVPRLGLAVYIQLVVGAVSSPVIRLMNNSSRRVVLQCESSGWYPEPEVLWLDGEGKLLSAGPTETVRGPDDLYTVSSRVTVEKRHSNSFTCRVHQKDTNHTRETHITVPVLSRFVKGVMVPGFFCILLSIYLTACRKRQGGGKEQETEKKESAVTENQT
ncbi:butyrophilin-like protein 10 [Centropristis striata]|uniref:butyrophilin-like protein 10 n=1 Tax=Centropristis striata TaxID=184440 RepID=UPI0027E09FE5|nr:butyrophilin-like protein 10 [Centropristis striata]